MIYDPIIHHRRSIRLKGYDYSSAGGYFITICTLDRKSIFGTIVGHEMRLSRAGEIARECWLEIPNHFPKVQLDEFIVMPDHMHGIIIIPSSLVGAQHVVPPPRLNQFQKIVPQSLSVIIRSFKAATTNRINQLRRTPGGRVWQRNYYEHIIRDEDSLFRIRKYIAENVMRWVFKQSLPSEEILKPPLHK